MTTESLLLSTYKRNDGWPKVKKRYKILHPECEICSSRKSLVIHHTIPFHIEPSLELDEDNLITLCDRCHLIFAHLNRYASYNPHVREDALKWKIKIKTRPKWKQML